MLDHQVPGNARQDERAGEGARRTQAGDKRVP